MRGGRHRQGNLFVEPVAMQNAGRYRMPGGTKLYRLQDARMKPLVRFPIPVEETNDFQSIKSAAAKLASAFDIGPPIQSTSWLSCRKSRRDDSFLPVAPGHRCGSIKVRFYCPVRSPPFAAIGRGNRKCPRRLMPVDQGPRQGAIATSWLEKLKLKPASSKRLARLASESVALDSGRRFPRCFECYPTGAGVWEPGWMLRHSAMRARTSKAGSQVSRVA
ncbi:hypothetical protein K227x_27010 [Rubripirellula lacrimiformis]|uniref:Uncharacterized protein n=1 Tax=Rubripirellula lacrimiformis TaxID=1930273 RepID=A0A517NB06_9BACT|nr:hypothetical protein K227x_27010 [Rubripirellula lacrimiformis]